ncbi:MAG: ATP-binding cassette domain-containing protein [Lentisphaeria bacterium]|nr:ATP-binding cassette domain-containing protein [Lentisphaeria bacterium]
MITFSHVTKSFRNQRVLDDLSFHVEKGETFMIVGPSGTGKSVTLSHIIGLIQPDSGEITVNGMTLNNLKKEELRALRQKVGMLFQGGALLNWMNIFDNVALPLRESTNMPEKEIREKVRSVLDILGLEAAAGKMPSEISGGMMKRAGLARALITEPAIMLYDEPTSGLDPVMSRRIDSLIGEMKLKFAMTSVVVTHDLVSALNVGDKIALLSGGRVLECAPPGEFLESRNPVVRSFIDSQFSIKKEFAKAISER